ncbi:ABC transporter ATP-binding protein [Jiangella aurantiaca]|uniref:ABC transporter ATP-binding protein n=1 Tax=Jiangella aurantiaca TaxID=2530373 RepID=A0A4R5AJ18_9ACTN|nr:ABC transporter ATP-binding protein [Jiangella aurantiaca]TDD72633.1 ABC transporter ATP-binding protein [Jiangella aurantiaca]
MRIRLADVTKRYLREGSLRVASDEPPALDHISLDIADGETVSVVGPSGCGKSTLLRLVAGLETADCGTVHYDEHDVADVAPQDRGIGMVFQDYALYPTMKGAGNLKYYFDVHRRTEDEARARAKEIADIMGVGFELLLGQQTTTLSGGEQQRVAIARCIVRDPTLFLMDEPIVNLDAKLRESTRMEMAKLLKRYGITTMFVTHDQQEAVFMGDRIALMRAGRVVQIGTFDELYYSPVNLFVATFFGSRPLAVLPATVADRTVRFGEAAWPLPAVLADRLEPGPVRIGVRPEAWRFAGAESGGGARMAVDRIESVPAERLTLAHGTVSGARVTVVAPAGTAGDVLWLTPDWEAATFFAADGEHALHTPGAPEFF